MNLEELYENFLRLEATLDLDPNPWVSDPDDKVKP
jgi:hypothetical protein